MAAEQGSPHAQYRLGLLLDAGFGMKMNAALAFEKYIIAAQAGIAQAQFNIGVAFDKGKVVQPSAETAVHWYGLASKQDLAEAQCNLGVCHEAGKGGMVPNMSLAVSLYRISADQGRNACACCNLGMCFLKGVEVAKDSVEGALWIGRAATLGNGEAQLAMALMHIKGLGLPIDHEQAISWLRQAASQGHATAMTALGLCYQGGIGVLQDTEQAVTLYLDAAGPGSRPIAWANALGMPAASSARALSVPVAKNTFATYLLGVAFDQVPLLPLGSFIRLFRVVCPLPHRTNADQRVRPQGIGVHADSGSAFEWYRKAAKLGHPRAQLCVGLKAAAYTAYVDPRVVFCCGILTGPWSAERDRAVDGHGMALALIGYA